MMGTDHDVQGQTPCTDRSGSAPERGQIDLCARQIYLSVPHEVAREISEALTDAWLFTWSQDGEEFMQKLADALKARIKKEAGDG